MVTKAPKASTLLQQQRHQLETTTHGPSLSRLSGAINRVIAGSGFGAGLCTLLA